MDNQLPGIDLPGEKTTVGSLMRDSYKSYKAKPLATRRNAAAIIGGVLGGLSSDDWGNSLTGTVLDAGIGAGLGAGVVHAVDYIDKHRGQQIKGSVSDALTVGDLAKEGTAVDQELVSKRANKIFRAQNKLAAGVAAVIGIGALASVRNGLDREVKVDQMKAETEKKNTRKQGKDDQMMNEMYGWQQHVGMGQLAIDMWDDRIGHHLMGNAKFK